jgi:hypothetical protein
MGIGNSGIICRDETIVNVPNNLDDGTCMLRLIRQVISVSLKQ